MKLVKLSIVLLLFLVALNHAGAQSASPVGIIPEIRVNYGFVTSEKSVRPFIKDGYFPLYELAFTKETYGLERYEIVYEYPRKGISLFYSDFGNRELFGDCIGALPFLNFTLIRDKKVFTWLRAGIGACHFTKRFNEEGFVKNKNTGSKYNAVVNLSPCMSYAPNKKNTFFAGVSFFHLTNLGLGNSPYFFNSFTGFLGWSFVIKNGEVTPQGETIAMPRKKWKTTVFIASGLKKVGTNPVKYFTPLSASITASRWMNRKSRLGITGDVFYDPAIPAHIRNSYKPVPEGLIEMREGLALNYTWVIGSLELPFDFGVYLFPNYVSDGSFYNRYGLRYFFQSNLFFNLTVKSHFFEPDHFEAGLGMSF